MNHHRFVVLALQQFRRLLGSHSANLEESERQGMSAQRNPDGRRHLPSSHRQSLPHCCPNLFDRFPSQSKDRLATMKHPFIPSHPQLSTLRAQTEAILKEAIRSGQWKEHLPSEAELCRLLKIGRVTVRSAVKDLAAQNLIDPGGKGRNHRIIAPPTSTQKATRKAKPTKIIRYLSNEAFHELGELSTLIYKAAEAKLATRGYKLVFEYEPGVYSRFSKARLEQIAARPDTAGWILFRTTRQIQSWFEEMGIPAVISGAAHPGVELPAVRLDYQGACRHAALEFLNSGHDNIAFVTPLKRVAAEEESIQSFLSVQPERPDARFSLIEHDRSMPAIIQGILAARLGKKPVTAYLLMEPLVAISTLTILQSSAIPVPGAVSIIARYGDSLMSKVLPTIAHYSFDTATFGRLVAKSLLQCIETGHPGGNTPRNSVVPNRFVPGGTLGRI
jgi:DNA-binding LacI/PurR family transcriptional regulator